MNNLLRWSGNGDRRWRSSNGGRRRSARRDRRSRWSRRARWNRGPRRHGSTRRWGSHRTRGRGLHRGTWPPARGPGCCGVRTRAPGRWPAHGSAWRRHAPLRSSGSGRRSWWRILRHINPWLAHRAHCGVNLQRTSASVAEKVLHVPTSVVPIPLVPHVLRVAPSPWLPHTALSPLRTSSPKS